MGFKSTLLKTLNVEENESRRVFLLLAMGFFMGIYLATLSVGAAALFLNNYTEAELETQLPLAILLSGILGIVFTAIYNFFQNRVKFTWLAIGSVLVLALILLGIEIGFRTTSNPEYIYFFAFTFIVPSNFIVLLVFWGAFGRMFNLRQSKRIIGSIDTGQLIASIIALFTIPIINPRFISTEQLLFITLLSILGYLAVLLIIANSGLVTSIITKTTSVGYRAIVKNKYISLMALFVVISMIAVNFIDYSFLSVTTEQFEEDKLASFLSLFEAAVVIFSFLFQTFVTDRIIALYGLRVSLLINPILLIIFTAIAIPVGYSLGYTSETSTFIFFFVIIAMSRLFNASLKDALDGPAFKLYFLPIDSTIRFDVQTKIEGVITALAGFLAGGLIILINNVEVFALIHISIFTLPILFLWYFITTKMHNSYTQTLQSTLERNKDEAEQEVSTQYAINTVLENEIESEVEEKVIYGLKLMEKLEPAIFETSILKLQESKSENIKAYAKQKLNELDINFEKQGEISRLAEQAAQSAEDSEFISVSSKKLHTLSKSIKSSDRLLAAKLLRKLVDNDNIFILLELLRDIDPEIRKEAIVTAWKVTRRETWTVLLEMLESPTYSNAAAAALTTGGVKALIHLENAFHKSGQSDKMLLKIVQIMGRIGGRKAHKLLWNKIDYPDKRIVKQILLSFRYAHYQAKESDISNLTNLLEGEIGKAIWNLAALTELPQKKHYKPLRDALKEEISENFEMIYIILSIMYDPRSVELVKENIETGTTEGVAFALELLDIFVHPDLKPKLFPLLDDIPVIEKLRALQVHFPREDYNEIQVLNYLLNKNYNHINRWTKGCALHAIAFMSEFRISRGLIAQLFNKDFMLQEAAAWVIYHKDSSAFQEIAERLPVDTRKHLEDAIEKNRLQEGLSDGFFLRIEMVMRLKQIAIFENIKGLILCDLVDKMHVSVMESGTSLPVSHDGEDEQIYIVADGEVLVKMDGQEKEKIGNGEVYGNILQINDKIEADRLEAFGRAVVFTISIYDFYNVMAQHHELAKSFINNVNKYIVAK